MIYIAILVDGAVIKEVKPYGESMIAAGQALVWANQCDVAPAFDIPGIVRHLEDNDMCHAVVAGRGLSIEIWKTGPVK